MRHAGFRVERVNTALGWPRAAQPTSRHPYLATDVPPSLSSSTPPILVRPLIVVPPSDLYARRGRETTHFRSNACQRAS